MIGTFILLLSIAQPSPMPSLAHAEPLAIRAVTPDHTEVPRYGRIEWVLDIAATYDNPFDPEDIDVYALFKNPAGVEARINGYFSQPYARRMENGGEYLDPAGETGWRLRFTPVVTGAWTYRVIVHDRTGEVRSPEYGFSVTASESPGFIRRNSRAQHIFAYDNGEPFFAIGENMGWPTRRGSYDYEDWMAALQQAGGNWVRIWMTRWHGALEWTASDQHDWEPGAYGGLGKYNLANAWKIDNLLDIAEKNKIQVMLCLGTYGEFIDGGYFNEGMWATNPYNAANGGPCAKAEDFWTDPVAKKYYKQRLRYQIARYGSRTNLFAWEFWNEAHPTTEWMAEMTEYMKGEKATVGADPYQHLLSVTYGTEAIWALPGVDFTMSHSYGEGNIPQIAPVIFEDARRHQADSKPHFMAEFGIDWRSSDGKYDTAFDGVNLHNALWASLASGNGGGAMIWYWDSYVHPGNLYKHFSSLAKFVNKVPWNEGKWKPLAIAPLQRLSDPGTWHDAIFTPTGGWEANPIAAYEVNPITGGGTQKLPQFLFGSWKPELRRPLVLKTKFEQAGRFELRIAEVSSQVSVQCTLDGVPGPVIRLSAAPQGPENPQPEYQSTALQPKYNNYQAVFHKYYGIDVPAGEHTISVDAIEGDWLRVEEYAFRGYVTDRLLDACYAGIANDASALIWVQNKASNWKNVAEKITMAPLPASQTVISGLPEGNYRGVWWDTWKEEEKQAVEAAVTHGEMMLSIPDIDRDIILLLQRKNFL